MFVNIESVDVYIELSLMNCDTLSVSVMNIMRPEGPEHTPAAGTHQMDLNCQPGTRVGHSDMCRRKTRDRHLSRFYTERERDVGCLDRNCRRLQAGTG